MGIIRTIHNRENPYVQINKQALWDQELSLEAVGLWARLLSRPNDWKISVQELCNSCQIGKDKCHRILNELIKKGYAYRIQKRGKRSQQDSQYNGYEILVFEFKVTDEEIKEMFPQRDNPAPEIAYTTKTSYSSSEETKSKREEEKASPSGSLPPSFPKRHKIKEERREVATRVWITPSQEEHLQKLAQGQEDLVRAWYERLSRFKISKGIEGGPKDFNALCGWVREAVAEDRATGRVFKASLNAISLEENEKLANKVKKRHGWSHLGNVHIGHNYIEFVHGINNIISIKFSDKGFREQVINNLRKLNLSVEGL